jgi:stage II sporulation protein AA (anti-sigma F factor antagonist)
VDKELHFSPIKNIVFDFDEVNFMDSSGIGMVIGRYKQIQARGGKTLIIRARPQVDRILELSGIKKIIEINGEVGNLG